MRSRTRTLVVSSLFVSALAGRPAHAAEPVDVSCVWHKVARRNTVNGPTLTPHMRGTVDVSFQGSPSARRISVAVYASTDGVSLAGAALATKSVRVRPDRTVRVAFDAVVPFGDAGRYLVARVDDADEVVESDETNNSAAAGPFSDGAEYDPLDTGTRWLYATVKTENKDSPVAYANSVVVAGDHVVAGGVVAKAVTTSNDQNAGPTTEYVQVDERGMTDWGDDDPTDELTPLIAPYRTLYFPFSAPYDVVSVSRHGLAVSDLDGDGRPEHLSVSGRVRFVGFEDLELPVGRFERCAHVRTRFPGTIVSSRYGASAHVADTYDDWLAPGVGLVRETRVSTGGGRTTIEETVAGFLGTSGGFGVVDGFTFADRIQFGVRPPGAASDGSTALFAASGSLSETEPQGLVGVVVSPTGSPVREFKIADFPDYPGVSATAAAAYGGGEYLVVYETQPDPLHARATTADGTLPWGATTLDLPVYVVVDYYSTFRTAFDGTNFIALARGRAAPADPIAARIVRVSPAGSVLGARVLEETTSSGGVAVAWDGSSALCVWSAGLELHAVRVDASGNVLDTPPIVLGAGPDSCVEPSVAASPDGGWFVAWTDVADGGEFAPVVVKGTRISAQGVPSTAGGFTFASPATRTSSPSVALDGFEFVVISTLAPGLFQATRVSLAGDVIAPSVGGIDVWIRSPGVTQRSSTPCAVQVGDRALVGWITTNGATSIAGAIVFPRRDERRRAPKTTR
jgi:hypothetical protein